MCCPAWAHRRRRPASAEYLDNDDVRFLQHFARHLRSTEFAGVFLARIEIQVAGMARMFMLEDDPRAILSALRERRQAGVAFHVDIPSGKPWSASRKLTRTAIAVWNC